MATQTTLFLFLFLSVVHAQNDCQTSYCDRYGLPIKFPFWLQEQQPKNCSYPGFNLSCSDQNIYLNIPYSGNFYVNSIDYKLKLIQLSDPENCLPRRLLSLNLSSSPFMPNNGYENYTFFSCPKAQVSTIGVIDCLSNSSTAIVATKYQVFYFQDILRCKKILMVSVPALFSFLPEHEFPVTIDLTWIAPIIRGTGAGAGINPGIVFLIPAFPILALIFISCCICMARRDNHDSNNSSTQTNQGLDEPTIETYKKMTIGESRCIPGSNDITCAICLDDYVSNDTLRFMPECEHCFHVECIDKWLRINSRCPICRINWQAHNISPC